MPYQLQKSVVYLASIPFHIIDWRIHCLYRPTDSKWPRQISKYQIKEEGLVFILYSVCVPEMEILIYLSDLCLCNVSYKGNLTSSVLATCLSVVQYLSTNLVTICGFEVGTHNTFRIFPYPCYQYRFVLSSQRVLVLCY